MQNSKYKPVTYTSSIEVAKSPAEVFDQLVALSKWWPEEYVGESIKLNTVFDLKTGDGHFAKNRVVEFVPAKKLVWLTIASFRKSDNFDWTGTKFIFELLPEGNFTQLRFTYDGVVLPQESERLVQICDLTLQLFYNFLGKDITI